MRSSAGSRRSSGSCEVQAGRPRERRCLVDSDHTCAHCQAGLEQFCPNQILTYGSPDEHLERVTYGGYCDSIVVDERFVLRVPSNLNLAGAAPLLCAGITTYSPMRHWGVTKGKKVGVVGLGGLGHMVVKLPVCFFISSALRETTTSSSPRRSASSDAFGAHVVVFTTQHFDFAYVRPRFEQYPNSSSKPTCDAFNASE